MNKRKTFTLSIASALVLSVLLSLSGFDAQCGKIEKGVLRLHVIANSDSPEDQSLKLKVRDQVLKLESELGATAQTKAEAMKLVGEHIEEIQATAEKTVRANGYDYPVSATLTNCYFPTKDYDTFTLPAGNYDALRVTLGSGEGKNWWCVLFPEICLGAATDFSGVLDESAEEIVTEPQDFKVKFKIVELYEGVREKINSIF